MRKIFSFIFIVVMATLVLAGCSSNSQSTSGEAADEQNSSSDFPNKPINMIVAYSAGGGTDTSARTLQPFLEDELGVTVNVINKPGGAGWVGWMELANAKPDGYTIGYLNSPNIASGLVNPTMERSIGLGDFVTLGNQVADPGAIAIRKDEDRFKNFKELIAYAKKHEVTTTATGVAGDSHLITLKLNKMLGTKFRPVQFDSTANSRSAFLGGHVDVLVTSVGEAYTLHENKQLKMVAVTAEERSPFVPDVPTTEEAGFEPVISMSTRGLAAPKGLDPEKVEILRDALEKAIKNEKHVKKMKELGTAVLYKSGEEYMELLQKDLESIKGLKDLLGW
ncbi:tripartite tricarboxylate transporter substrate binding protein [Virgibacillus necropolis]|uniref:Tripartite tricarboxylate transporter substrate binding protein n=1 Tax=Virgibacillus necropolis TaxID=163877 RepID=A0A221MF09_9BACI|nr:tripartite tricarboxylate transporter substrate binding protein [Virgibacillus necropolis]ASN06263.1 hypothetical protein CFK40_15165 [Virgibacillus necropolis]